jgi:hypothetical protein
MGRWLTSTMRKSRLYLLPVFKIEQMITLERQGNIYMQISTISEGRFPNIGFRGNLEQVPPVNILPINVRDY